MQCDDIMNSINDLISISDRMKKCVSPKQLDAQNTIKQYNLNKRTINIACKGIYKLRLVKLKGIFLSLEIAIKIFHIQILFFK